MQALLHALVSVLGGSACLFLAYGVGGSLGLFHAAPATSSMEATWTDLFSAVIVAPLVETWMLSGMIGLMRRTTLRAGHIALLCGLIWGLMHAVVAPFWFFGTAWPIFVFSCAYLVGIKRSYAAGFAAAAVPHAIQNAVVMAILFTR